MSNRTKGFAACVVISGLIYQFGFNIDPHHTAIYLVGAIWGYWVGVRKS